MPTNDHVPTATGVQWDAATPQAVIIPFPGSTVQEAPIQSDDRATCLHTICRYLIERRVQRLVAIPEDSRASSAEGEHTTPAYEDQLVLEDAA